ncbi:MAG: sulfotransferase [Burkholderia sp.]|nr:sulfotransferase [Burkholderia sp.]
MQSQPLWVVGAPRSGTTFLGQMLNAHPKITLTIEARFFALLKQLVEVDCARPDLLSAEHHSRFSAFLKRSAGGLIERYYRDELGVETPIWGDKHPPYGDPVLLSGRDKERPPHWRSGSALPLIAEVLPDSKFIHITRAPNEVAHSLLRRGWVSSLAEGESVRHEYVEEIDRFFEQLGENGLRIDYGQLLARPEEVVASIAKFLGIAAAPMLTFLRSERRAPTPFSEPVRNLNEVYRRLEPSLATARNAAAE